MKYQNFIVVDQKFYSVFNREVDDKNPDLWKSFIPHRGFTDFLNKTISSLNREKPQDTKSIWLYGSYGTGKTFAVFVLKHLLEDSDRDVDEYISTYSRILGPYRERINGLRREGILVVYKSSAGHVNTPLKLNLEVMHSIHDASKRCLSKKNLSQELLPDDIELLIRKVKEAPIDWESFLRKYSPRLFYVNKKSEILSRIERNDLEFASRLIDCLGEEGFSHFAVNDVNQVKRWIEAMLDRGVFSKILFIWDEFSEFFSEGAPIFTFQELVHLTQKVPFYFLIVTHKHLDFWRNRFGDDIRKLKDRFIDIHFTMENITVYKLLTYLVKPRDVSSWETFKNQIIEKIRPKSHYEFNRMMDLDHSLTREDIEGVFPLHPYSVYLTTRVVEYFGSTNRTVFNFMKSDHGFVRFLQHYPKDEEYLLTADFLWDFFFVNNPEISTFHPKVRKWINYWNNHIEKLESEEEKRIFKIICILFTLKEEIVSIREDRLLKPTLTTLNLALSGTTLYGRIPQILKRMDELRVIKLHKLSHGDYEILDSSVDVNQEDLERIKAELPDFPEFVKNYIDVANFKIHRRLNLTLTTDGELKSRGLPNVDFKPYEIPALLVLTKEGGDIKKTRDTIKELSQRYRNWLFILSLREVRGDEFGELMDELALERLYREQSQISQARYHESNFKDMLNRYVSSCKAGDFFVLIHFEDGDVLERNCVGLNNIDSIVKEEIIPKVFPYSLENKIASEPLWINRNLVKRAINFATDPVNADKAFNSIINELISTGFLDNNRRYIEGSLDREIEHTAAKIMKAVKERLTKHGEVNLREFWDELNRPPFGLYDSAVGVFMFTFVLSRFILEHYVIDEHGFEAELNVERLKSVVEDTIRRRKSWSLRTLSKEQRRFCDFVKNAFDIDVKTPIDAVASLREKLRREIRYPLWFAKYVKTDTLTQAKEILENLSKLIRISHSTKIEELNQKFREFFEIITSSSELELRTLIVEVRDLVTKLRDSFEDFIYKFIQIEDRGDFSLIEEAIRERLQEEPFLWTEESFENLLKFLRDEIRVISSITESLGFKRVKLTDEFVSELHSQIKRGKLAPLWVYENHFEAEYVELLKPFFEGEITYKDLVDSQVIQRLNSGIVRIIEMLRDMIDKREEFMRRWIREKFEVVEELVVSEIESEFWSLLFENQKISEEQVIRTLKPKISQLRVTALRFEISEMLKNHSGDRHFETFLRRRKIPLSVLKYHPEIGNLLRERDFFSSLMNLNRLTVESLDDLRTILQRSQSELSALCREDSLERILREFLAEEWDWAVFKEDDFRDFLNFYLESDIDVNWSEKDVINLFRKWKERKYQSILPELENTLNSTNPEVLREVVRTLLRNPDVGFRILKELNLRKG